MLAISWRVFCLFYLVFFRAICVIDMIMYELDFFLLLIWLKLMSKRSVVILQNLFKLSLKWNDLYLNVHTLKAYVVKRNPHQGKSSK